jgi:hypothetical protein
MVTGNHWKALMKSLTKLSIAILLFSTIGTPASDMATSTSSSEPRFSVQKNGRFGFIDKTGTLVIPANLHAVSEFSDSVAIVMPKRNSGVIIDAHGKTLGQFPRYTSITPFSEGLAAVMRDDRHFGYVNSKGEVAIPLNFSAAASFSEGLAAAADQSGKWGWIDRTGRFVIAPQFGGGGEFKEGMARFGRGNKSGYLDKTGKVVVEANYFTAQGFSEGLGLTWDGNKKRFLNRTGETVIELPGDASVQPFKEGLAAVKIGTDVGFIDMTGKMALKVPFDAVGSFSEGLAPVRVAGKPDTKEKTSEDELLVRYGVRPTKTNEKWGCIDRTGKVVIPPQFPSKPEFKNGLAKIRTPEGIGYIDRTGAWVWKPSK